MNRRQIAAQILEAEKTLANLREKLKLKINSFKLGDVFSLKLGDGFDSQNRVPIIVAKNYKNYNDDDDDRDGNYFVIGNYSIYESYMRPYSDCKNGLNYDQMLDYLNNKIEDGWFYVGNISSSFDEAVRELLGRK